MLTYARPLPRGRDDSSRTAVRRSDALTRPFVSVLRFIRLYIYISLSRLGFASLLACLLVVYLCPCAEILPYSPLISDFRD